MDAVNQNSEYPVSQNTPKCTQLTNIDQNSENQSAKMDQNERNYPKITDTELVKVHQNLRS